MPWELQHTGAVSLPDLRTVIAIPQYHPGLGAVISAGSGRHIGGGTSGREPGGASH